MAKGKLGFGWMRLPQRSETPEDIDFEQVNQMVDAYLDAGFDYFDTVMCITMEKAKMLLNAV